MPESKKFAVAAAVDEPALHARCELGAEGRSGLEAGDRVPESSASLGRALSLNDPLLSDYKLGPARAFGLVRDELFGFQPLSTRGVSSSTVTAACGTPG